MERVSFGFGAQVANPRGIFGQLIGRVIFAKGNAAVNNWVAGLLDIQPTTHALEVGCGPGLTVQRLAARAPLGRVVGIDRSPVMIHQARKRNASAIEAKRVEIRLGDAAALPYPDATFDLALAVHVIYFWPDATATLRELRRVLRPGGVVAIGFVLKQDAPRTIQRAFAQTGAMLYPAVEDVAALLAAAEFTQVHVERQEAERLPGCCALAQRAR
jgi:ubiquinone/menaquinone biosynthesis C-methylase UbiE